MASTPEESAKAPAAAKSVPPLAAAAKSKPTPAATASTVFMPTKPKFGGIREVYKDSFVSWTGGEPQGNWSGLADLTAEVEPNQFCCLPPTTYILYPQHAVGDPRLVSDVDLNEILRYQFLNSCQPI